jgi:hypothetical protein
MANLLRPLTAEGLRDRCAGWPAAVVRSAVSAVVARPQAAILTAWLVHSAPSTPPQVPPALIAAVWLRLQANLH